MFDFTKLVEGYFATGLTGIVATIIGSSLYDLRQIKRQKHLRLHRFAKQYRHRPLISIVVYTENSGEALQSCLQNIVKNSYRKYEIIIVDNASTDHTKPIVKEFIHLYPRKSVKLFTKRQKTTPLSAIREAVSKFAHGDLLMVLRSSDRLGSSSLNNAASYFANPGIDMLHMNVQILAPSTLLGLYKQYDQIVIQNIKKAINPASQHYELNYHNYTYRRHVWSVLCKRNFAQATHSPKAIYGHDVTIYTAAPKSYLEFAEESYGKILINAPTRLSGRLASGYAPYYKVLSSVVFLFSQVMVFLTPLVLGYFAFLALYFKQTVFLGLTLILGMSFLLWIVCCDNQISLKQKSRMVYLSPIVPGLFYIASLIRSVVLLYALARWLGSQVLSHSYTPKTALVPKKI